MNCHYCNRPTDNPKYCSMRCSGKVNAKNMKCRKDMLKLNLTLACYLCGYDKHINFCRIKPVKSFPDTATVNEINSPDNLTILCPNHHWELDHNMLDVYVPTITEMTRKGFEPLSPT